MPFNLLSKPITEVEEHKFCVEVMKRLNIQRRNEQFCDVILEVGSGDDQARLTAHRVVLCAGSPFFENALNSEMKEKREGVIRLEETSKAVMKEVLEYLYTGHVDINEENAFDLLQIADFLIVPSLKKLSSKFISKALSSSNCINAYYSAERYQCPELQKSVRDFALANFMDVAQYDEFLSLSVSQVEEWISSDDITVQGEEDVFRVIVKWMERDESRKIQSFFDQLFRHVRLVYVSRSYVFNVILPHPLVKDSTKCTTLVLDAMKELSCGTEESYFAHPPRSCLKTHEDAIVACGMKKRQALCYIPLENKWYKLADMRESLSPRQRIGSTMSTCHGKAYLAALNVAGDCAVERYDPMGNSWAPVKPFAGASTCDTPSVVSFHGFLYMIGGRKGNRETNGVHRYNPETNLWQEVAPMSIARQGVCAVADRHSLYAIGGRTGNESLDVVEKFDPERNRWERIASTLEKKAHACGAIASGKVFLFGGFLHNFTTPANLNEMYDPSTDTWSSIEHMGGPRIKFSAVSFKGKVLVIGASLQQRRYCNLSLQVYDVDRNEWEHCSSISADHELYTAAALRISRDILDDCVVVTQE